MIGFICLILFVYVFGAVNNEMGIAQESFVVKPHGIFFKNE